jgi:hypothetical protein
MGPLIDAGAAATQASKELLAKTPCFDKKFEIRFRTQRPKADGKGMVHDFDVEVRTKNLDRRCLVDELSRGQFVLVNEAVNLGLSPGLRQTAKALLAVRSNCIVPRRRFLARCAPAGEAEAGSAGAHPARE